MQCGLLCGSCPRSTGRRRSPSLRLPHAPLFAQLVQVTGHRSAAPPSSPICLFNTIGLIIACWPLGRARAVKVVVSFYDARKVLKFGRTCRSLVRLHFCCSLAGRLFQAVLPTFRGFSASPVYATIAKHVKSASVDADYTVNMKSPPPLPRKTAAAARQAELRSLRPVYRFSLPPPSLSLLLSAYCSTISLHLIFLLAVVANFSSFYSPGFFILLRISFFSLSIDFELRVSYSHISFEA